MQKFVALFSIPAATMEQWVASTSEEERASQMETMMKDWESWKQEHAVAILDEGLPLGKTKRVTKGGVADARNDLNYFMVVEAETPEAAAELFLSNPHLRDIPDSYVDVMGTRGPSGS